MGDINMNLDDVINKKQKKVIASNGTINIIEIIHSFDDFVVTDSNPRPKKIYYERGESPQFKENGVWYKLDEFFKVD